ncbi:MAG: hypothetical protein A2Z57_03365 [Planctomycetes bacterium RIFCSPHIGHO2_12_39_6]|nr:MAG: hypothetical protein A2Z57_03365 [Planctomycetes bacterium RIFCSPHIGHO2_12_39_6]
MIIDELKELIIQYEDEGEIGLNAYTDLIDKLEQLRPFIKTELDITYIEYGKIMFQAKYEFRDNWSEYIFQEEQKRYKRLVDLGEKEQI